MNRLTGAVALIVAVPERSTRVLTLVTAAASARLMYSVPATNAQLPGRTLHCAAVTTLVSSTALPKWSRLARSSTRFIVATAKL